MLNPFFLQGSKTEQGLIQDLINEQLRMYGIDVHYLPRQYITEKTVIREVIESEFNNAYPIEAYIDTYDGYSDNPTILSKFGIQALNEITLIISRERFKNYISPLIENQSNIKLSTRPKEGDLIYFPLGKRLFEVKYVEHEKPFYQLQGLYTYQLRCELFRYEDEVIDTSIDEIDELISGNNNLNEENTISGNITNLTMVGVGITATATASIVNGGIRFITVTNRGGGYTSVPTIGITSAPPGGQTATAIAEMIGGIVVCNENINPQSKSVQKVLVVNSGYGYTIAPGVRFIGGGGKGATATATIGNGIIGTISITNSGSGYVTPPSITFAGIASVSAAATAVVSAAGSITSIYLTNAGLGYTQSPIITISNPALTSTGNFTFNELVTGSQSGVTARVKSWNSTTNVLQVAQVNGQFIVGENIVGSASSASHYLRSIDVYVARDGYVANDEIEEESDQIIDFDETNPFGMP
ncbi:MAG: hypothetical protein ACO3UU_00035 [Minisyncoccia bacterium]